MTHYDVTSEQCQKALEVMLAVLNEPAEHARLPSQMRDGQGNAPRGPRGADSQRLLAPCSTGAGEAAPAGDFKLAACHRTQQRMDDSL